MGNNDNNNNHNNGYNDKMATMTATKNGDDDDDDIAVGDGFAMAVYELRENLGVSVGRGFHSKHFTEVRFYDILCLFFFMSSICNIAFH